MLRVVAMMRRWPAAFDLLLLTHAFRRADLVDIRREFGPKQSDVLAVPNPTGPTLKPRHYNVRRYLMGNMAICRCAPRGWRTAVDCFGRAIRPFSSATSENNVTEVLSCE